MGVNDISGYLQQIWCDVKTSQPQVFLRLVNLRKCYGTARYLRNFFPIQIHRSLDSIQKMTKFYPRNHEVLWKWGHRSFTRPPFPRNQSPNILELHNRHTVWHWRARLGDKFSWIWIQFAWIQIPIQPTLWSRANYLKNPMHQFPYL